MRPFPSFVRFPLLFFFFVLLFCTFPSLTLSSDCGNYVDGTPILNCDICKKGTSSNADARCNDIHGIPRVNRDFKKIETDLGFYSVYTCDNTGENCKNKFLDLSASDVFQGPSSGDKQRNVSEYVYSLFIHICFGVAMAILVLIISFCIGVGRYCCSDKCCGEKYVGGCCCNRFPTKQSRYCCGVRKDPNTGLWQYSKLTKGITYFLLLLFVLFTFIWIGLGYFQGVTQIPVESKKTLNNGPNTLANTFSNLKQPLAAFFIDFGSKSLVNSLVNINQTFTSTVNFHHMVNDSSCVTTNVDNIPVRTSHLIDFVIGINQSLNSFNVITLPLYYTNLTRFFNQSSSDFSNSFTNLRGAINTETALSKIVPGPAMYLRNNLTSFDISMNDLLNSFTTVVRDLNTTINNFPTANSLDQIATDNVTSLAILINKDNNPLINNTYPLNDTQRTILLQRLTTVNNSLALIPAINQTIVVSLNSIRTKFKTNLIQSNLLGNTIQRVQFFTNYILANFTASVYAVNTSYTSLNNYLLNTLSITPVEQLLLSLNSTLFNLTDFTPVMVELDTLREVRYILPCLTSLYGNLSLISSDLVALPTRVFDSKTSILNTVNNTLNDVLASINSTNTQITSFMNDRSTNLNITFYQQDLNRTYNSVINATISLGNEPYLQAINSFTGMATQLLNDLITLNSKLTAFNTSIYYYFTNIATGAININATSGTYYDSAIASLNSLSTDTIQLQNEIKATLSATRLYDQGACATDGSVLCTAANANTVCPAAGSCVNIGMKRCRLNGLQLCPGGTDAECTSVAGDNCLISRAAISAVINHIASLTTPSAANNYSTVYSRSSIDPNGTSSLPLAQAQFNVTRDYQTNTQDILTLDASVETQLFALSFALTQANSNNNQNQFNKSLDSINSNFNSYTNITNTFRTSMNDITRSINRIPLNSTLSELRRFNNDSREMNTTSLADLRSSTLIIQGMRDLFYSDLQKYIQTRLTATHLEQIMQASNTPSTGLFEVMSVFDNITATAFPRTQQIFNFTTNAVSWSQTYRETIDILSLDSYREPGALYMLGMLFDRDRMVKPTMTGVLIDRINKQRDGTPYPNNTYCLLKTCIDNSVDYYMTNKLSVSTNGAVNVDLTPQQIQAIPYVLPVFVVIWLLLASMCYRSVKLASCFSSCALAWSVLFLIILFLLGCVTLVLLLFSGDVCYSMENVINQYATQRRDALCNKDFSGNGTSHNCVLANTANTTFSIDLNIAIQNVLGGRCSSNTDAIQQTWTLFNQSVLKFPENQVNNFLRNQGDADSGGLRMKDKLYNTTLLSARSSVPSFTGFVTNASTVVTCSALAASWSDAKTGACCGTLTAVYWSISAIYLLAWTLLFCGCSAGFLGRKRFSRDLWGPVEEENKKAALPYSDTANKVDTTAGTAGSQNSTAVGLAHVETTLEPNPVHTSEMHPVVATPSAPPS